MKHVPLKPLLFQQVVEFPRRNYPRRFMEPVDEGPAAGNIPVGLEDDIIDYYRERGWDDDGKPTMAKLKEIGLEDYVD